MKLTLEPHHYGRVLCADGVTLPMQRKVTIVSEVGEPQVVIVEFIHDGNELRILADPPAG